MLRNNRWEAVVCQLNILRWRLQRTVSRCLSFFPCEFTKKPPLLCATLEMPFQHRMAVPSSLHVPPHCGPLWGPQGTVVALPMLNAHRSAC